MPSTHRPSRGFTIVEMIVVVGIITLLVAIVLPAISGVRKQGKKVEEMNDLRQVGIAWNLYSNSANDRIIPGYLEPDVQAHWDVSYYLPDKSAILPDNAAPYTWRLAPFLDDITFMLRYSDDDITATDVADYEEQIGLEPAFGYNAYYVGGWYRMTECLGLPEAKPRFFLATDDDDLDEPENVVALSIGQMPRAADQLVFASSTLRTAGSLRSIRPGEPGAHYVVPPVLADENQWTLDDSGTIIEIVSSSATAVPAGRHTEVAAVLFGDAHVDGQTPGALTDMRLWIGAADEPVWTHGPGCDN